MIRPVPAAIVLGLTGLINGFTNRGSGHQSKAPVRTRKGSLRAFPDRTINPVAVDKIPPRFPSTLEGWGKSHAFRHQRHRRFSQSAGSEVRGQAMDKNKAASPEKKAALKAIRDEFKGIDSRSQAARLLEALLRYSITTFEAMRFLDVYYCPARIMELRKQGHNIITHWQTVITESGECHRVGLYVLAARKVSP